MRGLTITLAMMLGGVASAQTPVASPPLVVTEVPAAPTCEHCVGPLLAEADGSRNFLQSDHEFPDFIGPITSPILSKDPRSLTEVRPLFINNWIPRGNAVLQGGDFQVYAMQARIALTERLTLIADKDGIATLSPRTLPSRSGWLDLAAGLKYTLYRDVENQALGAVGFLYEAPSGEAQVFQNHGSGLLTVFGVWGQQFGDNWHILINQAFSFGLDSKQNSNFFFTQVHLDKQCFGWLYPLAELNWYQYVSSGDRGLPPALGEGDGLINFGTSGMSGKDLLTGALGLKAKINRHIEAGAAWETPLSSRKDLVGQRLIVEMIFRY